MAEATTPLAATIREFDAARGDGMDSVWAHGVSWSLLMRDVDAAQVREGLCEALDLVRRTQMSPEELYGESREHADELYRQWAAEGHLFISTEPSTSWRDVPASGLVWSAVIAGLLPLVMLLDGETTTAWTWGRLLLPLGLGMGTVAGLAAWESVVGGRRTLTAVVVTGSGVLALAAFIAAGISATEDRPFATAGTWWFLVESAVLCLLALGARRALDSGPPGEVVPEGTSDEWSRRLTRILRTRHWMPMKRVRIIVAEAHSHASESGRSVQEEFGTPEEYAARFSPVLARKSRLATAFWSLLGGWSAVSLLSDGFRWMTLGFIILCTWWAVSAHRRRG